jgi:twinkle protein
MTTVVRTEPCPKCQEEGLDSAGDNVQVFESGVKYCVARHGTIGKDKESVDKRKQNTDEGSQVTEKKSKFYEGVYRDIKSRNLSERTCKHYGYMVNVEKQVHIANYYNAAGELAMQQVRTADKKFPIFGDKAYNDTLWGAHLFTPNENVFITITEGQIDALSIAEAFQCKYPVVSLPNGVRSDNNGNNRAAEVLTKNKKYLDGFKYVVLAFDNDGPGNAATKACLKVLEPGKVRIARWPQKDANDMLKLNDKEGIRQVVYSAVEYIPEPILTGIQLMTSLDGVPAKTRPWPWPTANKIIRPIRIPSVISIAAKPGIGKTEFVSELMRGVIDDGGRIGVIALEQTVQGVLVRLTDSLMGSTL